MSLVNKLNFHSLNAGMHRKNHLKRIDSTYESPILNAYRASIFGAKIFSLHICFPFLSFEVLTIRNSPTYIP